MFYSTVMTDHFPESSFYAPQAAYAHDDACTLLRNPHIARNEELQLSFYDAKEERKQMRHYYFGHLTDVVMVDSNMLAAERLGGADYDGDMIKTISDPILNACVRRNYNLYRYEKHKSLTNTENIPLLMILTAQPQIRSADDWEARFETVRSTFSSRVGLICKPRWIAALSPTTKTPTPRSGSAAGRRRKHWPSSPGWRSTRLRAVSVRIWMST